MTSISLPGASGSCFVRSVFTCWACVAVANPKVKINTGRMSFFLLCIGFCPFGHVRDIRWRGPKIKRDLLATPFQYGVLEPAAFSQSVTDFPFLVAMLFIL